MNPGKSPVSAGPAPEESPARENPDASPEQTLDALLDLYQTHQRAHLYHAGQAAKALRGVLEILSNGDADPEYLLHAVKTVIL